jgi:hypothetical protein
MPRVVPSAILSFSLALALVSCTGNDSFGDDVADGIDGSEGGVECTYPEGAVEPMALGEVLSAHSWATAIHADGTTTSLDLLNAHCDTDEVIDWSVHELLVFIAVPAW